MPTTPNPKKKPVERAPATAEKKPAEAPAPAEQKKPTGNGKTILIVEDEKPLAHALEMKLKNEGYNTRVCMNGSEALEELKKGDYALALLDLIMPVVDGFAVLQELRNRKSTIPVIVLSNLGQEEDRAKTKELGAIDYFVKSNTPLTEIIKRVKAAL